MTNTIKSPFTGGKVKEVFTMENQEFRGEEFLVHAQYFVCEDTGQHFTNTEQDAATFNELYAQYRIKHGIPFPEEIKAIRTKYGLSCAQAGRLLGFGANQWGKYEAGQVPSESNGRMIAALRRKSVALSLIEDLRNVFEADEYRKLYAAIISSIDSDTNPGNDSLFYFGAKRSIDNGFGEFNHRKVEEMVKFFASGGVFPTKLNKEMFYADFSHFRKHGISISGLRYQAIHYGPVPVHYSTIYDNITGIEKELLQFDDHEAVHIKGQIAYDPSVFSEAELRTITEVKAKLDPMTTREIVELSHREDAWLNHYAHKEIIPFFEAYKLKEFAE